MEFHALDGERRCG